MSALANDLKRVSLFCDLSERQLGRLARDFKRRTYAVGMTPVREGEMSGVGFFVVADGEASVSVNGSQVGTLRQGDHFGELSLITERTRTATVTAVTPLECLEMTMWDFRRFVKGNPDVAWKLLRHLAELAADSPGRTPRHDA